MTYEKHFYPESRFGGFTHVDGTANFFTRINALLEAASIVLDVGCGRGEYVDDAVKARRDLRILRAKCARVIGIDVDAGARVNPVIDEFRLIEGLSVWPVADSSVDLCICDHVIEHVADPRAQRIFVYPHTKCIRLCGYGCEDNARWLA
jgi:SAM-dependent methyltransferase